MDIIHRQQLPISTPYLVVLLDLPDSFMPLNLLTLTLPHGVPFLDLKH